VLTPYLQRAKARKQKNLLAAEESVEIEEEVSFEFLRGVATLIVLQPDELVPHWHPVNSTLARFQVSTHLNHHIRM
jgi:hypothetical protein